MEEVNGVIPNLARLIFSSIRTGAVWATETFISYCEFLVRSMVQTTIAVIIAIGLINLSTQFDSNWLLLLGATIGGGFLLVFALKWSLMYMGARLFASLSDIAKEEIEKLSNVFFLFIVTLFYLGIDQGQRHPTVLKVFLGMMFLLFLSAILPGRGKFMTFFRERFQLFVLVPVALMTILAAVPEAMTSRVTDGFWLEKVSRTVSTEVAFRIDEQDQIIDLTTNQPMRLFQPIHRKGEEPKATVGWTKDKKGNYHLWTWFDKQGNLTPAGQEITPVTLAKVEDIVIETKRLGEKKIADAQKLVDDQKAKVDAETARLKAVEVPKPEVQLSVQPSNEEVVQQQQADRERAARDQAIYDQRQLALRTVSVTSTVLAPANNQSQDIVMVRPDAPFRYGDKVIQPTRSVMILAITEVRSSTSKDAYELILQPQTLVTNGQRYNIIRQSALLSLTVKKDNSHSRAKVIGGAIGGAILGAFTGGKKGAVIGAGVGALAGTVYALSSHGKKFQLTVGGPVPPIFIRP